MDKLKDYIRKNYETDDIKSISTEGCENGQNGLIYYSQTTDLYKKFHAEIWDILWGISEEQGITQIKLISNLIGQDNVGSDTQFKNLLVWYAFEHVCTIILSEAALLKEFEKYEMQN